MSDNVLSHTSRFHKIGDPTVLLPLLEKRLPKSSLMYNSVKMHPRFLEKQSSFYALDGEILDESAWIVCTHFREDEGQGYHISADENKSKLTKAEAIEILSTCPIFKWDAPYYFAAVDIWISEIVYHVSVRIKGHFTVTIPCHLFYKDIKDCLDLDIKNPDPSKIEIKPLDVHTGVQFLLDDGKDNLDARTIVRRRYIEKNESAGVYVDGIPVCGTVTRGFGILGSLKTVPHHRRKGYAILAMQFAFKESAQNGLIPATLVVPRNLPSIKLHEKLGCKNAGMFDFVEVWPSLVNKT